MTEPVYIARCPEHGLHGERSECFVCGAPVEQVPMIPVEGALTEEMTRAGCGDMRWGPTVLVPIAQDETWRRRVRNPDPAHIGVELESWRITPECRQRGVDVAWEDAISRLRQVYRRTARPLPRRADHPYGQHLSV